MLNNLLEHNIVNISFASSSVLLTQFYIWINLFLKYNKMTLKIVGNKWKGINQHSLQIFNMYINEIIENISLVFEWIKISFINSETDNEIKIVCDDISSQKVFFVTKKSIFNYRVDYMPIIRN